MSFEILSGIRMGHFHDRFRSTLGDKQTAGIAALRAEINDPVCTVNHIQIMLNDKDGVALRHEAFEHTEKMANVLGVKPCRRLVQHIEGAPFGAASKFCSQLHALRLSAGQRGRRLPQMDIPKSHIGQGV